MTGRRPARLGLRLAGLAVATTLLWVAARNVPWRDTLVLRHGEPAVTEHYRGQILSDWKVEPVRFRLDPSRAPGPDSPLAGHPLATVVEHGGELQAWRDRLSDGDSTLTGLTLEWRPGMPRAFGELDLAGVAPAVGFVFLCSLVIITRWWRLLALCGCATTWWTAFRLTYVGLFFNALLPGSTGGDLARAYVVVRGHPERRADALVSVVMDRFLGLVGMALVALVAVSLNDERFARLRPWVLGASALMLMALAAFVSPTLRRVLGTDRWLRRIPQGDRLARLDRAMRAHGGHPFELALALGLSAVNHVSAACAVYWLGHAFGDDLSFLDYLCISSVANTLTAVPISPGGLGVGEVLYGTLFRLAGGLYLLGVAASFTYRMVLVGLGLAGGVVLLAPGGATVRRQFAEERAALLEAGED